MRDKLWTAYWSSFSSFVSKRNNIRSCHQGILHTRRPGKCRMKFFCLLLHLNRPITELHFVFLLVSSSQLSYIWIFLCTSSLVVICLLVCFILFLLFMCCMQKDFHQLHVQQKLCESNKVQNCEFCKNIEHSLNLCHQGVPKQLLSFILIGSECWNKIVRTTVSDSKFPFNIKVTTPHLVHLWFI